MVDICSTPAVAPEPLVVLHNVHDFSSCPASSPSCFSGAFAASVRYLYLVLVKREPWYLSAATRDIINLYFMRAALSVLRRVDVVSLSMPRRSFPETLHETARAQKFELKQILRISDGLACYVRARACIQSSAHAQHRADVAYDT